MIGDHALQNRHGAKCLCISWKTPDGKFLSQLRADYLEKKEKDAEHVAAADR
jgi:hypothetical protein